MEWNEKTIQDVADKVIGKATTDAGFRRLALADPKAAIAQFNNEPIPESFSIRLVDNAGANLTMVLPPMAKAEGELSDRDLEQVAGGSRAGDAGKILGTIFGGIVKVLPKAFGAGG